MFQRPDHGIHQRLAGSCHPVGHPLRVLALVISRAQIKTTNYLGQRVLFDLRQGLFEHVEHLPFSFFDHRPAGKIISRITNDVNHIGNLAASGVINVVSQMISLVGIIVIMMSLHWRMAALSFTTIPFLALVLTKLRWALQSAWGDTRKAVADINAHLNETIQGLQVIQAFGRESSNSMKFDRANRKFFGAYMRAVRLDQAFWPLADIVGAAGTCIVIWYGAKEYLAGSVTLGLMLAFTNYLGKFPHKHLFESRARSCRRWRPRKGCWDPRLEDRDGGKRRNCGNHASYRRQGGVRSRDP